MLSGLAAGQLVYLKGNFSSTLTLSSKLGTASEWIIFRRWPGEPTRAKFTSTANGCLIRGNVSDTGYICIEDTDFETTDHLNGGIYIYDGAHHVHIVNCDSTGSRVDPTKESEGIQVGNAFSGAGVNNIWIDGCTVDNVGSAAGSNNVGDGILVHPGLTSTTTDVWIVRNTVGNCGHIGINVALGAIGRPQRIYVAQNDIGNTWAGGLGINGAQDSIFEDNDIHDSATNDPENDDVNTHEGIFGGALDCIIRRNRIYNNWGAAIHLQAQTDYVCNGNHIYHNTMYGNGGSLILNCRPLIDANTHLIDNIIENNLMYNNHQGGETQYQPASVWSDRGAYANGNYQRVYVLMPGATGTPWPDGEFGGNIIRNNWLSRNDVDSDNFCCIIQVTPQRYYTLAQFEALTPDAGSGNVDVGDPLMTDPGNDYFRLQAGSLAIDAGTVIAGQQYYGSAPDLGAYERWPI